MELLKAAMEDTSDSLPTSIKDDPLVLDLTLSNTYTSKELYLFLKHHKTGYPQYVNICSTTNILPLQLEDCPAVLDYVNTYNIPQVHCDTLTNNRALDFTYILNMIVDKNKGILTKETKQYIIVPENINSLINIRNIKNFLYNKKVQNVDVEELLIADNNLEIEYKSKRFWVVNTIERFTSEDWNNVACIFLDGTPWQLKQLASQGLVEIFEVIRCFYVYLKGQYISKLKGYNIKELSVNDKSYDLLTDIDFDKILLSK